MKQFKRSLSMLLALVMLMSMVYLVPAAQAASASTYIATTYAANLSVKTTRAVNLMEAPSTSANAKYTLPVNTTLTVKALHKNTSGTWWYEVQYYSMTLYLDATATTLLDHLTGDVTISNVMSPASLDSGASFPIQGDISATLNDLGTVSAAMYTSSNITKAPTMIVSDNAGGKSYSLKGSAVDSGMAFNTLATGVYTYLVTAEAISYYIDDNGALATAAQTVVLEQQQCVITDWANPNDELAFGIDVSVWNGSINWASAKNDIDYAILRIGFEYTMDTTFLANAQGCVANGIPWGIYIYSYAETEAEAIAEANFVINTLRTYNLKPDLPLWFDFEDECQMSLSSSTMNAIVKGFCKTISDAGYLPGIYTFKWIMNSYLTDSYYDSVPIWIAQIDGYSSNGTSTYDGGLWQWQYSWTGTISGISGSVDCNYYYAEMPGVTSDTSYLSKCTYYPAHSTGKLTASTTMRQYPSTSHSSVGTMASGKVLEITGLYKNASGEYWYQAASGSTIGYVPASSISITEFLYDDLAVIDPVMASNINLGSTYSLSGIMVSQYNTISTAYARIYSGEDTLSSPVLSASYATGSKAYDLARSEVDNALAFNSLTADYYTYEISADVKNYYVSSGTLTSKTENVVLWTTPFTVGSAPIEPPAEVACDHNVVTDAAKAATCTATGLTEGSHCTKCGVIFKAQDVIPAKGHSYTATSDKATCQTYEVFHYRCTACGDRHDVSADQLAQWSETKPLNVPDSQIQTKTQYRYADCTSTSWTPSGSGSNQYVPSWPSGFDTTNSLYTKYKTKVTNTQTATTKTVVDADTQTGYLYYHWCSASDTNKYSYASKSSTHTIFHAYYDTTAPSNYTCDTSDMSYKTSNSACPNGNSLWFFVTEVNTQSYTTYTAAPDGQQWGSWSAWSDTVYTAVENSRKVETRTMYRYTGAAYGDHVWANGSCSLCGTACSHSYVNTVCTICGMGEPIKDYYLFGNINGANYGCEEDYENVGDYLFVDGKLTVTFTENSYVAVKSADNSQWFMTDGFLGQDVTSAKLYNTVLIGNRANKLFVPKGRQIIFTLKTNTDGTLTLSYELGICDHQWSEGVCSVCGNACGHHWVSGKCSMCGMAMPIPTVSPKFGSLSFESEVMYNIYFTGTGLESVSYEDMGLLTWTSAQPDGTIHTAHEVIPGASFNGTNYMVRSRGIAAKNLADTIYFKVYVRLADGSYAYSSLMNYSGKKYANTILGRDTESIYMKRLVVAMLNYGSAAQEFFGYKSYALMNASLTAEQKAMVTGYDSSMMDPVVSALPYKVGIFTRENSNFKQLYPSVSFDGAFSLNYYCTPAIPVDDGITLYWWDADTYSSISQFKITNATGTARMITTGAGDQYWGQVPNIAAQDMDKTYYVSCVFTSGGKTVTTGIISYSLGKYCSTKAATDGDAQQAFAKATAVYGYYAKEYFALFA